MSTIRVLLADDHPVVRSGIRAILERTADIEVVAETDNGSDVCRLISELHPDVVVLDVEMPEVSGLEVAQQITDRDLDVRILALSAHVDDHYVDRFLEQGAAGYLVKEEAPAMIVDAVRGVARGEDGWISRRAAAQLTRDARHSREMAEITPREQEVLRLVADGKTNQEIARELQVSESTIEKHVGSLLEKLHVSSRVEAAVQAVRNGWV